MTAVGIDVGGIKKGFHCVALRDGQYASKFSCPDAKAVADWCRQIVKADVIAIDAPCRWSNTNRGRPAELALMAKRIYCFSSPTREKALAHRLNHYGWMLQGEAIFQALEKSHPLAMEFPITSPPPFCFETFPHAIAWHLQGGQANAKRKRIERKQLLQDAGIDTAALTNIDLIDAALCALVADHVATGKPVEAYGEPDTGFIVVPRLTFPDKV
jgi:predicted nuclease with RNAse H fold